MRALMRAVRCAGQQGRRLDGYQLFEMIEIKYGVPYAVEFRKLEFAGKQRLYLNIMWK
jgi:hypothetical protein